MILRIKRKQNSLENCSSLCTAHTDRFCRKELGEKVGVKVRFFIGVSQRTHHRQNIGPTLRFYRSVIWCTRPDFLSELLCVTMAGKVPLLDYVTPMFYRTEVSAHGSSSEKKSARYFIGQKSAHWNRFSRLYDKKSVRVRWPLGIYYVLPSGHLTLEQCWNVVEITSWRRCELHFNVDPT